MIYITIRCFVCLTLNEILLCSILKNVGSSLHHKFFLLSGKIYIKFLRQAKIYIYKPVYMFLYWFLKIKLSAQLQRLLFCFHLYYVSIQINIYTAVFQRNKKINSIFMQRRNTNTSRHIQKCATINCKEG